MPTPLREAALAAVAARLEAQIPLAVVERARRAPVDTDAEDLPRLVLTGEGWTADETIEPMQTHYTIGFAVTGYAEGDDDLAAEQAVSALHAQVVAALAMWTPADVGLGAIAEQDADLMLFDAAESAAPAGMFVARFSLLAIAPSGSPYSP